MAVTLTANPLSVQDRVAQANWGEVERSLTDSGFAPIPRLLTPRECVDTAALYERSDLFRSRIDMVRYRFGRGEYQYFRYHLPPLVQQLRTALYPRLAPIANHWQELLNIDDRFAQTLSGLLELCHKRGQVRPTPLLLRYREGDYNCLHQDVYGDVTFPLQVVVFLSKPDMDYTGGEFLLAEQIPRAQTKVMAFRPQPGDALVITTRHRPARSKRGWMRVAMRHGVSPLLSGTRYTLGIVFHDSR